MHLYDSYNPLDFQNCLNSRRLFLFGAAKTADDCISALGQSKAITAIVDNAPEKWNLQKKGISISSPSILTKYPADETVVLITSKHFYEIAQQLETLGIRRYFHYETMLCNQARAEKIGPITAEESARLRAHPKYRLRYDWCRHEFYAHGLGAIDGIAITNSLEAFLQNYKRGFRIFEGDIARTQAGEIILCHARDPIRHMALLEGDQLKRGPKNTHNLLDADGVPYAFDAFRREKIFGTYTPLSWRDLVELLQTHPDVFFIPDLSHCSGFDLLEAMHTIVDEIDPSLLQRMILEINTESVECLDRLLPAHPFGSVLLIHDHDQYLQNRYTDNELIRMCLTYGIQAMMVGRKRVSKHLIEIAEKNAVYIGTYRWLNESNTIAFYRAMGVRLFCVEDNCTPNIGSVKEAL